MSSNQQKKKPSIFDDGSSQRKSAIAGRNIYIDDKGQTIMYLSSNKTGYLLKEKDVKNFTLYHNRLALAIALFMLLITFVGDLRIALIAGLALLGVLEYRFRQVWLPTLPQYPDFVPSKKKTFIEGLVSANNKPRCILLAVLYAAFGILLVANGIVSSSPTYIIVLEVLMMLACLYMSARYIIAVTKMK